MIDTNQIADDAATIDHELENASGVFTANDGRRLAQLVKRLAEAMERRDLDESVTATRQS